jgi:stage III sporulation protein AH
MKSKTKKYLLLAGLIVVLVAVGYINFALGNDADKETTADLGEEDIQIDGAIQADDLAVMSTEDYFDNYKVDRENKREEEVAILDSIIDNEKSDAEMIKDAQTQKIEIVRVMEAELKIEGLLAAAGFSDSIVTVQTGSVNVVIDDTQISKEDAAKILEIVREETDEPAQNIKVILQG